MAALAASAPSWWGAVWLVEEQREAVGKALLTVLETTEQALSTCSEEPQAVASAWPASPGIVELTEKPFAAAPTRDALIHPAATWAEIDVREARRAIREVRS